MTNFLCKSRDLGFWNEKWPPAGIAQFFFWQSIVDSGGGQVANVNVVDAAHEDG